MEAGYLVDLEVKGVGVARGETPGNLGAHLLLYSVDHVKLVVVLYAHDKLVRLVLDASRHVPVCKVSLSEGHYELKGALLGVPLELAEEHAVVATEADLGLARRHDDVKNCVDLERLRLQHLPHRVHLDDVDVAEVLPEDQKFFLDSVVLVLK